VAQLSFWVTWIPEGQTEEEAINSHVDGYLELGQDGVPTISPADSGPSTPVPTSETDAFLVAAAEQLRMFEPSLREDEERRMDEGHLRSIEFADDLGHWIYLSPGQAWIRPNWSESATFDRCWGYLQLLTGIAPSVTQIETSVIDDDDRFDVSLDVDKARECYGW
jgi:hypothetical protein